MPKTTSQKLLKLNPQQRQDVLDQIKNYFSEEFDQEIGDLQAELFLEFIDSQLGKHFYNQGVHDTIREVQEMSSNLILLAKE
jgi:uncharacterized protein (DUF2164 family)